MNIKKIFASGLALAGLTMAFAQGPGVPPPPPGQDGQHPGMRGPRRPPTAEGELKRMTEHLGLSKEQQKKIKPILENFHKQVKEIFEDRPEEPEATHKKIQALRDATDKKVRSHLTDAQKKKFDQRPKHGPGPGGPPPGGPGEPDIR